MVDLQQLKTDYYKSLVEYRMAQRKVLSTIENIQELLETKYDYTIFDGVKSRIKEFDSAVEKCNRKNYENTPEGQPPEFNIQTIRTHMQDVAGIRVITVYRSDIYLIYEAIKNSELAVTHVDDYIKTPKDSGYRSLHLLAMVSIVTEDGTKLIPTEIQLRTKTMDAWATLDHDLRYKDPNPDSEAIALLQGMAITMDKLDDESERIRERIRFKKPAT